MAPGQPHTRGHTHPQASQPLTTSTLLHGSSLLYVQYLFAVDLEVEVEVLGIVLVYMFPVYVFRGHGKCKFGSSVEIPRTMYNVHLHRSLYNVFLCFSFGILRFLEHVFLGSVDCTFGLDFEISKFPVHVF